MLLDARASGRFRRRLGVCEHQDVAVRVADAELSAGRIERVVDGPDGNSVALATMSWASPDASHAQLGSVWPDGTNVLPTSNPNSR